MPGRMGADRVTVQNLKVLKVSGTEGGFLSTQKCSTGGVPCFGGSYGEGSCLSLGGTGCITGGCDV